jgi:hypothetical protein
MRALSLSPFAAQILEGSVTQGVSLGRGHLLLSGQVLSLTRPGGLRMPNGIECELAEVALSSAKVNDPTTGTWSPTGSMITARSYAAATLFANGKVLVVGGENPSIAGESVWSAELTTLPRVAGGHPVTSAQQNPNRRVTSGRYLRNGVENDVAERPQSPTVCHVPRR